MNSWLEFSTTQSPTILYPSGQVLLDKYFCGCALVGHAFRRVCYDWLTWAEWLRAVGGLRVMLSLDNALHSADGRLQLKTLFDSLALNGLAVF